MAKAKTTRAGSDSEPTKAQLQRQMAKSRESLAETVGEIKETVEQQVDMVTKGVSSVLNYREEFQKDPLVWSLGALSAGFALGYTVGYAHKNTKGAKQGEITAFADTMIEQLSTMGQGLVLPALDAKISELFGFDFSSVLAQIGADPKTPAKKPALRRVSGKSAAKPRTEKKKKACGANIERRGYGTGCFNLTAGSNYTFTINFRPPIFNNVDFNIVLVPTPKK